MDSLLNSLPASDLSGTRKCDETEIYRSLHAPGPSKVYTNTTNIRTAQDVMLEAFRTQDLNRQALGFRKTDANGKLEDDFTYETLGEIMEVSKAYGAGLKNMSLADQTETYDRWTMTPIGIFGKNSRDYFMTEYACYLFGFTVVGFYDSFGADYLVSSFEKTQVQTCHIQKHKLELLESLKSEGKLDCLKNIVMMDLQPGEIVESPHFNVYTFEQVLASGRARPINDLPKVDEDSLLFIAFTSGTTGFSKGAMISNKGMITFIQCCAETNALGVDLNGGNILTSQSMAHVIARREVFFMFKFGMRQAVWSGEADQMLYECQISNPTIVGTIPRNWKKIYNEIKESFKHIPGISAPEIEAAIKQKMKHFRATGSCLHPELDEKIFSKLPKLLGNKAACLYNSGANLLPCNKDYISVALCVPFCQSFGMTELNGTGLSERIGVPGESVTGGPYPHFEVKLVTIPDTDHTIDYVNEKGQSRPRGELCFRGDSVFVGYYNDPKATAETIDEEGWMHAGDIAELNPETGTFKIVDRKKNCFNLGCGSSILPERVESHYINADGISEAYITWDIAKRGVIGIFSLDPSFVKSECARLGLGGPDAAKLIKRADFLSAFEKEFDAIHKEANMAPVEKLLDFRFISSDFRAWGFLTATGKIRRNDARRLLASNNEVNEIMVEVAVRH